MFDARACAFVTVFLLARPLEASTIVARSDGELVAMSDRVVHARVVEVHAEPGPGQTIVTVARLHVIEDFTGDPTPEVTVREFGGRLAGRVMHVSGAATYELGAEVLVCLERGRTGYWRSVAMGYSHFRVVRPQGPAVASGNGRLSRSTGEAAVIGPVTDRDDRDLDEFRRVAGAATGARSIRHPDVAVVPRDVAVSGTVAAATPVSGNFTLLAGGVRWNEADLQQPVSWFRNADTAPPAEIGDADAAIALALEAWTAPPTASITLTYGGLLSPGAGDPYCGAAHAGAGLVSFEDPTSEIPSGTLALGGGCADAFGGKVVNGTQFDRFTHGFVVLNNAASLSTTIRSALNLRRVIEHEIGHGVGLGHSSIATTNIMYPSCCAANAPVPPALGADDLEGLAFIYPPDVDQDTLPDAWEVQWGLDPASGAGHDGAGGDPDGDGATNADELANGTHPRGFHRRYFAEGATSAFFETALGLANPHDDASAHVLLTLWPAARPHVRHAVIVAPLAHARVVVNEIAGMAGTAFSTVVESDVEVAAVRTLTWNRAGERYGAHAERATHAPSPTWFFAEGATHSGFALFYLLQNPNAFEVDVDITYLRPPPLSPVTRTHQVGALARSTVWVNFDDPQLSATDVSASLVVRGNHPIVAERAMYLDRDGVTFEAGHASAGAPAPAAAWHFAEGRTGAWFDEYLLLANPSSQAVEADVSLASADGARLERRVSIPAQSRVSLDVEHVDAAVADADVTAIVRGRNGAMLVAERALWWGGSFAEWIEAHASFGATMPAARWLCAAGEVGGSAAADTFVLVANGAIAPREIRVTLLPEGGGAVDAPFTVAAGGRLTIDMRQAFPGSIGRHFGVLVESAGAAPDLVVEQSTYWSASALFRAGANHGCVVLPSP